MLGRWYSRLSVLRQFCLESSAGKCGRFDEKSLLWSSFTGSLDLDCPHHSCKYSIHPYGLLLITVPRKTPLCSNTPRIQALVLKHDHPLGHMVRIRREHNHYLIHHRQRRTDLRRSSRAYRCPVRPSYELSANGDDVDIR